MPNQSRTEEPPCESRPLILFVAELHGLQEWARQNGEAEARRLAHRWFTLQEITIRRGGAGQVLHHGAHFLCAAFEKASDALNRALEIQRVLAGGPGPAATPSEPSPTGFPRNDAGEALVSSSLDLTSLPRVRIGLHFGEILFQHGGRLEILDRHLLRAQRLMEAAGPGHIYASEAVIEAGRDLIDVPKDALATPNYGDYYLNDVGATNLCEVADLRVTEPAPPGIPDPLNFNVALPGRLKMAGYGSLTRLGEGPHGVVYQATHTETGNVVALKVLAPRTADSAPGWQGLAEELARVRPLQIPGMVRLLEVRLDHDPAFLVMERVEGQPIDKALRGANPIRVARVFQSLCGILSQAHAAGVVHGDLKPTNILLRADDAPCLMDFGMALGQGDRGAGLSAATDSSTVACRAPEVLQGDPSSAPADIYSVGVLLFKVLTGRDPFVGRSVHEVAQAHRHEDPRLPRDFDSKIPDGLQRICLKALEKAPAERYANFGAMAGDLDRFLRGAVVRTRPTACHNRLFHRAQKHAGEVKEWSRRGLLSQEESDRLLAVYDRLQRRGFPSVMAGGVCRLWQTLVCFGGWAVVNGALLWLVLHWEHLERVPKLLLSSVPALTAFVLAYAMITLERFRLAFLALVAGVAAIPLLAGIWLYEFKVGAAVMASWRAQELFYDGSNSAWFTNPQILLTALATFAVAASLMLYTRTTAHSAQALVAFALLYAAELLFFDLKPLWTAGDWATISLKLVPLMLACIGAVWWLLRQPERPHQAAPWILFSALLAIGITDVLALHGLKTWTTLEEAFRRPAAFMLLSVAGAVQIGLGLGARPWLQHRGRLAMRMLVWVGSITALAGLALAGLGPNWPATWWSPRLFGQSVPVVHLALPLASLAIALLACRYPMFPFLGLGLAGFAVSIHLLGKTHFTPIVGWPMWIVITGAVGFFAALWMEWKRTRGNPVSHDCTQQRL